VWFLWNDGSILLYSQPDTPKLRNIAANPRVALHRRQAEAVLAVAINFPDLVHEFAEEFAALDFRTLDLDKLREAILKTAASSEGHLDGEKLRLHLCETGFQRIVDSLLSSPVYVHAGFARPNTDIAKARGGWLELMQWFRENPGLQAQLAEEERDFAENMTDESWARMQALLTDFQKTLTGQREEENGAAGEALP